VNSESPASREILLSLKGEGVADVKDRRARVQKQRGIGHKPVIGSIRDRPLLRDLAAFAQTEGQFGCNPSGDACAAMCALDRSVGFQIHQIAPHGGQGRTDCIRDVLHRRMPVREQELPDQRGAVILHIGPMFFG
jgi:hypothetical protein